MKSFCIIGLGLVATMAVIAPSLASARGGSHSGGNNVSGSGNGTGNTIHTNVVRGSGNGTGNNIQATRHYRGTSNRGTSNRGTSD
jgi:hypothetical protein